MLAVETIWLDTVDFCDANFAVPGNGTPGTGDAFFLKSRTWRSPFTGVLAYAIGHVHSGGIKITLSSDNNLLCDSYAQYRPDNNEYIG